MSKKEIIEESLWVDPYKVIKKKKDPNSNSKKKPKIRWDRPKMPKKSIAFKAHPFILTHCIPYGSSKR